MARPRAFDVHAAVTTAGDVFSRLGYSATSIDDLISALGLHRGSLYQAFGSKRGLFLAALRRSVEEDLTHIGADTQAIRNNSTLDLVLVAALELAPVDDEIRDVVHEACTQLDQALTHNGGGSPAGLLGERLLRRGRLTTTPTDPHS